MTYLTDNEAAERYHVSRPTIWRWLRTDPQFPKPLKLSPGATRWRLADLERWEQARASAQVEA